LSAALFRSGVLSPPPHDRVTAAVMLADPEYNPADPRTAGSTVEPPLCGSPRGPAFPALLHDCVRSYCRRHDIVCQRDAPATMLYAVVEPGLDQMQVCLERPLVLPDHDRVLPRVRRGLPVQTLPCDG
jgi:hypothetical protein